MADVSAVRYLPIALPLRGDSDSNPDYKEAKLLAGEFAAYHDLWELHIDVPGSGFREADFLVDPKFSQLGPWRRCFRRVSLD